MPVVGQICLTQADLTASSESQLLHQGLTELLVMLLQSLEAPELAELSIHTLTLQYPSLALGQGQFTLITELASAASSQPEPTRWHLKLQAALRLIAPSRLQLRGTDPGNWQALSARFTAAPTAARD